MVNPCREHISLSEARKMILAAIGELGYPKAVLLPTEEGLGLVLAEDVLSNRNVPHYVASAVDGYAVVAAETSRATPATVVRLEKSTTLGQYRRSSPGLVRCGCHGGGYIARGRWRASFIQGFAPGRKCPPRRGRRHAGPDPCAPGGKSGACSCGPPAQRWSRENPGFPPSEVPFYTHWG